MQTHEKAPREICLAAASEDMTVNVNVGGDVDGEFEMVAVVVDCC